MNWEKKLESDIRNYCENTGIDAEHPLAVDHLFTLSKQQVAEALKQQREELIQKLSEEKVGILNKEVDRLNKSISPIFAQEPNQQIIYVAALNYAIRLIQSK